MNTEYIAKLRDDLETSGFVSELHAAREFDRRGWYYPGPTAFYDLDSGVMREVDIAAHVIRRAGAADGLRGVSIFYQIVAEVKKSKSAWIALRGSKQHALLQGDGWQHLICADALPGQGRQYYDVINATSLAAKTGWRAHGIHESFNKPDDSSRWYGAFVSACKGAESALAGNFEAGGEEMYMFFAKPIVILDGDLLSASLSESSEVELAEVPWVTLEFRFRTERYTRERYGVDLVTLRSLGEYLERSESRADTLFNAVMTKRTEPTSFSHPETVRVDDAGSEAPPV